MLLVPQHSTVLPYQVDVSTQLTRRIRLNVPLLSAAMDVFDRKVQLLERSGWFADLQRKRRALDALLPTIRATTDALTRDLYVARLSEAAGVERSVLLQEMHAATAAEARRNRVSTPMATPREMGIPKT